jgi:DNA transformation protein
MPNSPDFVAHVLELMRGAGTPTARAMFGGHGLYVDGTIVGIVVADVLYLKTDEETRQAFIERGGGPFEYKTRKGVIEGTSYYQPPEEALESPEAMREWLRLAMGAALRAASRKSRKSSRARESRTRAR